MPPGARDLEQLVEPDAARRELRLGRAPATHRDDHRPPAALLQHARPVPGDRRLARTLAGRDHRQLRPVEGDVGVRRRVESHPGGLVCEAQVERECGEAQLARRRHHRLVREVHDRPAGRARGRGRGPERLARVAELDRPPVVLRRRLQHRGPGLLLAAAEDHACKPAFAFEAVQCVADHGGVMLAVDEGHGRGLGHAAIVAAAPEPSRERTKTRRNCSNWRLNPCIRVGCALTLSPGWSDSGRTQTCEGR